ncbi:MAG: DUF3883 domain-containing protein [Phenylobacterium sp.]
MSTIEALAALRQYLKANDVLPVEAAEALVATSPSFASNDYEGALVLHAVAPPELTFESFDSDLRTYLEHLIENRRPWWRRFFPAGRTHVASAVSDVERQTLSAAKLFEQPPSPTVMEWWYRIQASVRSEHDLHRSEQGGEAELLTLAYERERLSKLGIELEPELVGFESSGVGYDIKSFDQGPELPVNRLIEVKSSTRKPPRIVVPRTEWEAAIKYGSSYYFYVWALPEKELTIRQFAEMEAHIPSDAGKGCWLSVEIEID